MEDKSIKEE